MDAQVCAWSMHLGGLQLSLLSLESVVDGCGVKAHDGTSTTSQRTSVN